MLDMHFNRGDSVFVYVVNPIQNVKINQADVGSFYFEP
jgi:hypothetical protein